MNLLRFNKWRKGILAATVLSLVLMFSIDWGYHFHIGHAVRLLVGAFCFWIFVDKLE